MVKVKAAYAARPRSNLAPQSSMVAAQEAPMGRLTRGGPPSLAAAQSH